MFPGPVGGKDECCMDTEFPFGRIKKVLEMDGELFYSVRVQHVTNTNMA